jgi:hypothetical protein
LAAGFADPALTLDLFTDPAAAKRTIAEKTGRGWLRSTARGMLGVARAQLRQALGGSPGYPGPH